MLKKYYEGLLLDKDIRIGELEIENRGLRKNKEVLKKPEIYVMI
jgi:hypothetical protein